MGTFCSRRRRCIESDASNKSPQQQKRPLTHSQTLAQVHHFTSADKMYSPFRGLRRGTSNSAGSLLALPPHTGSSSNFSYPFPRTTHTTLVVPSSAIQQRDRTPLFDDSPTSTTPSSSFGGQAPFRRPPLNRAIPPIPESKSNESIISQASQLTHRHSISGTSVSLSQKEPVRVAVTITAKEAAKPSSILDNSVVIENKMAQNLGARFATNMPITSTPQPSSILITSNVQPSTSEQVTKKTVAIITTRRVEEPSPIQKPTRLPLTTNKQVRTNKDEPRSPLLSMAHSLRSRINKLGTSIGRATSRSPIRSSRSMVSMRRDTSNLDKSGHDTRLSKSTSEQPVVPPPPTTSPPNDEDLDEQLPSRVTINSQRSVSQIPRRFPSTTLIPSPVGVYFRRLPEEDRLEKCENEGPILTIDSKEALPTPDENPTAPILLLRKVSGELTETPLENAPKLNKKTNFRRHKHSHSFGGGDSTAQIKTPKMNARIIVRQPSEPLYYQTHRRSKSRDEIISMRTPIVPIKRLEKSTGQQHGNESVKTTRSLKIVTYSTTTPELADTTQAEEKKFPKPAKKSAHKKSQSVDISTVLTASKKYSLTTSTTGNSQGSTGKRGATALCSSSSASNADEMRLHKHSLIPRTVKWVNKNKKAPLAIAEQSRVANSPAVELPPNSFEDADLKRVRQSRLVSPARTRRMIFWRSKSKSANEKANNHSNNDRNNNSKSVDQTTDGEVVEEFRTITTARITTRAPPPSSPQETDSNGNNVQKTPNSERETRLGRLTLNELLSSLSSPIASHKRIGNAKALQEKQRSGLIDDEIIDQPMLISTELVLIDEQTPTHSFLGRDLNENFQMNTNDGNLFQQRTVRVRENENSSPVQYVPSSTTIQQQPQHISIASQSKIPPHEHAAIEKIIEDLSSQLSRIKEFAIEDEDEMKNLRLENNSLKEELVIKDQVIQLLMSRLKDPGATSSSNTDPTPTKH